MTNLLPIIYSETDPRNGGRPETIAADYQPSINAAFTEIFAVSGIKPIVLRAVGGARTKTQCNDLGTPWWVSDHYQDATPRRAAADVDNYLAIIAKIGADRYYGILAKHGWHNITTDGKPFPREGWHVANHDPTPQTEVASTKGTKMDYRQIREQGSPALFADTTGLVVEHGLTPAVAGIRRAGRTVKVIERRVGESSSKWAGRKAAIIADWDREAAANLAALKG